MGKIRAETGSSTTYHTPARFKDGSFSTSNNAGGLTYTDKEGNSFSPGEEGYAKAVQASVESGLQYEGDAAYQTAQGTLRSKQEGSISEKIEIAEGKQAIYGELITAIDNGAQTGYLSDLLPSMTEATVALNNLQGELGLNVLQSTTFGALSKDELKFALSTALPTSMEPEALRRWVVRKQEAQRKLIDYLYEAGDYIGQGGTQFGFMAKKRREQRGKAPDASSAEAPTSNLDFLPEEERAEAQQAIDAGLVTIEKLRES